MPYSSRCDTRSFHARRRQVLVGWPESLPTFGRCLPMPRVALDRMGVGSAVRCTAADQHVLARLSTAAITSWGIAQQKRRAGREHRVPTMAATKITGVPELVAIAYAPRRGVLHTATATHSVATLRCCHAKQRDTIVTIRSTLGNGARCVRTGYVGDRRCVLHGRQSNPPGRVRPCRRCWRVDPDIPVRAKHDLRDGSPGLGSTATTERGIPCQPLPFRVCGDRECEPRGNRCWLPR